MAAVAVLAACGSPEPKAMVHKQKRSKEYFSEAEYGVKASPRVSLMKAHLPRGGGRDQLGRPYKIRGKWYRPREERGYNKVGMASWYGDAFHGRLTANGEIYDMTHLTAAHPTMPLPSYARVTNTENGSSVIVRVNDRGPYSDGRIIDLSKRAAQLLDYTHSGTAKVQVEYVGRAPLHGLDDRFLMASYRPGNQVPDPYEGLPDGVMIAMNGQTPGGAFGGTQPAAPFPGELTSDPFVTAEGAAAEPQGSERLALPAQGPWVPERPGLEGTDGPVLTAAAMSYAANEPTAVPSALAALEPWADLGSTAPSWKSRALPDTFAGPIAPHIAVGSYSDAAQAARLAERLADLGRVEVEQDEAQDGLYMVNLYPGSTESPNRMIEQVWARGARDAFAVHD